MSFARIKFAVLFFILFSFSPARAHAEELIVSAAASLTNAFKEIGAEFEKSRPNLRVIFNFGASDALVTQIAAGAPVDVFVSADQIAMDKAAAQELIAVETRIDFASNTLVIATSKSEQFTLGSLNDLMDPTIKSIAISKPDSVPIGRYAQEALEAAGLWNRLQPKYIFTQNVRQSLDYLSRREVQVGFVYASDIQTATDSVKPLCTVATKTPIRYSVAVIKDSAVTNIAKGFIAYLKGSAGQGIVRKYGFVAPK